MQNPLNQDSTLEPTDEHLVEVAILGDAAALQQLLGRQQLWIFNLAFYMLHSRVDAEDATQEVLVKIATNLGSFKGASSFRTWARRIAVNHVLDARKSRPETVVTGFDCYSEYLEKAPNDDVFAERGNTPETAILIEEARISCTLGMLLCLDREQRIVFLLGEILETSDTLGAELLEISKENFRQRLSRARDQLSNFISGRCGLLDEASPCRCARKTSAFIRDGIVDPKRLQFSHGHVEAALTEAKSRSESFLRLLGRSQEELRRLYSLFEAPDVVRRLASLIGSAELKSVLNLN
jgi:RNA polymerase sigma factor (sigma-70 family)